jgi:hypothetical protein
MEKRLNFNTEVDNLTRINEFFQNFETPTDTELEKGLDIDKLEAERTKSA